jgi:hypothetical protein
VNFRLEYQWPVRARRPWLDYQQRQKLLPSPPLPGRLSDPSSPLSEVYCGHSTGVKRPEHEAGHSLPSSADVGVAWKFASSSLIVHGVVLGTGTTLSFALAAMKVWTSRRVIIIEKGKVVPVLNYAPRHEGVLGEWMHSSTHFDLGITWRWVVSFTPRPLYPKGKIPWYPLDRRLCGPQSRSGRSGEEKIPIPRQESNPRTPVVQPVTQRYTDWAFLELNCLRESDH